MRMPCLTLTPATPDADSYILQHATLDTTGAPPEPTLAALAAILGEDVTIEAVRVARNVTVWCDEEFRCKDLSASAIIIDPINGDVWDFGGPVVITYDTNGTPQGLAAFARLALRVPPPGYRLAEPEMTFQSFTEEEFEAHRRLIDAEGGQP